MLSEESRKTLRREIDAFNEVMRGNVRQMARCYFGAIDAADHINEIYCLWID